MSVPEDKRRIKSVLIASITYLEEHLGLLSKTIGQKWKTFEKFLCWVSTKRSFNRYQFWACVILKLMHVIYHLKVAELRFQVPLSEAVLLDEARNKSILSVKKMLKSGLPIVSFYGNRKAKNSIITKLLAKKRKHCGKRFLTSCAIDQMEEQEDFVVRFDLVVSKCILFNYIIPSQSHIHFAF